MDIQQVIFWLLSVVAVFSSLMVITRKNPVYSVLYLIVTFFAISGLYLMLNAQFLAIVNIIVYAGAIMVLFLFVLMLMNLNRETEQGRNKYMLWASALAGGALAYVVIAALLVPQSPTLQNPGSGSIGLIRTLGSRLFTDFVVPFEISSILFLSAMIGAVVLGKKTE